MENLSIIINVSKHEAKRQARTFWKAKVRNAISDLYDAKALKNLGLNLIKMEIQTYRKAYSIALNYSLNTWEVIHQESGALPLLKSKVKELTLTRHEGPVELTGIAHTFYSFKEANDFIISNENSVLESGYDKHSFTITWENGDKYNGNIDLSHPSDSTYDINTNRINLKAKANLFIHSKMELPTHTIATSFLNNLMFND